MFTEAMEDFLHKRKLDKAKSDLFFFLSFSSEKKDPGQNVAHKF